MRLLWEGPLTEVWVVQRFPGAEAPLWVVCEEAIEQSQACVTECWEVLPQKVVWLVWPLHSACGRQLCHALHGADGSQGAMPSSYIVQLA